MRIDELIERLSEVWEQHGNLHVDFIGSMSSGREPEIVLLKDENRCLFIE